MIALTDACQSAMTQSKQFKALLVTTLPQIGLTWLIKALFYG